MFKWFSVLALLVCLMLKADAATSLALTYNLNYDSTKDKSVNEPNTTSRTYHKIFLGASVNDNKSFFLGLNTNKWSNSIKQGNGHTEDTYSLTEFGPKILWFVSESRNWYFSADYNPVAKGTRTIQGVDSDLKGSSYGFSLGYRFKIAHRIGIGASITQVTTKFKKESVGGSENSINDSISFLMPMIELSYLSK